MAAFFGIAACVAMDSAFVGRGGIVGAVAGLGETPTVYVDFVLEWEWDGALGSLGSMEEGQLGEGIYDT